MSETRTGLQLGVKRTTAGGGADSEARRTSHLTGDHRRHRDHEHDEELGTFVPPPPVNGLLIDPFFNRCPA